MRISDWSSDVCSSDLPDVTELIGCFQLIIRMAWLWIGEDAKARREDVAVAGQSCIGIILIKRQKIEIETGFPYDIRLVEEAAPEDEVETFAVPFDFVIQDAFLVVGQSLQRKRSEEHTSELQSLMRTSYAVFCLKKKQTSML